MIVFDRRGVRLYHGDCREIEPPAERVNITDPPYGYSYESGREALGARRIKGDDCEWWDVALDAAAAAVFGVWHRPPPLHPKAVLVWDKGAGVGMGDLSIPWKPNHEMIWVFGEGWRGRRTTSVLRGPVLAYSGGVVSNGRIHPTEKPGNVLCELIQKAPPGVVFDPFAGSASTLVAALRMGREAVGVEIDEQWIGPAVERLHRVADELDAQGELFPQDSVAGR